MATRATKRNIFGLGKKTTYRVTRAPGRSNETTFKGARVWQTWPEGFKTSADPDSTFDTLKDAKAFISWQQRNPGKCGAAFKRKNPSNGLTQAEAVDLLVNRYGFRKADAVKALASWGTKAGTRYSDISVAAIGKRRNPADGAAEVYEEFHGRPSSEVVTVSEKIHYHKNLAALGELRNLVVLARDGAKVTLSRFKKAILCTNEQKDQLFVRGGDQAVDVREFGIKTPHEVETLGKVVELAYFTRKDHLGDEGGTALYFHVAGETNENGKRKMAGWSPDLIYRKRDEALEFSGGSYTIRAEGVDK
jgi:hypothetical protein